MNWLINTLTGYTTEEIRKAIAAFLTATSALIVALGIEPGFTIDLSALDGVLAALGGLGNAVAVFQTPNGSKQSDA